MRKVIGDYCHIFCRSTIVELAQTFLDFICIFMDEHRAKRTIAVGMPFFILRGGPLLFFFYSDILFFSSARRIMYHRRIGETNANQRCVEKSSIVRQIERDRANLSATSIKSSFTHRYKNLFARSIN